MTALPQGWVACQLMDVASKPEYGWTTAAMQNLGPRLVRTTDLRGGRIDWSRAPGCRDLPSSLERYLLQTDDILVSRAGTVGVSTIVTAGPPAVFASYLMRIRANAAVNPRYLALFLQSPQYWRQVESFSSGIAIPNINATKLGGLFLPLPPAREQQRIVGALDAHLSRLD